MCASVCTSVYVHVFAMCVRPCVHLCMSMCAHRCICIHVRVAVYHVIKTHDSESRGQEEAGCM